MYIFTPNMKFLCLTMWLGGLYTNNDNTNANADNDDDGQSIVILGSLVDNPKIPYLFELAHPVRRPNFEGVPYLEILKCQYFC